VLTLDPKTVVNAVAPPELAEPVTNLRADPFSPEVVVSFVHPVGAEVCWNSIRAPESTLAPRPTIRYPSAPVVVENVMDCPAPMLMSAAVPSMVSAPVALEMVQVNAEEFLTRTMKLLVIVAASGSVTTQAEDVLGASSTVFM